MAEGQGEDVMAVFKARYFSCRYERGIFDIDLPVDQVYCETADGTRLHWNTLSVLFWRHPYDGMRSFHSTNWNHNHSGAQNC